jgi:CHAT domain-containing protein
MGEEDMREKIKEKNGQNGEITHPDRNLMVAHLTGRCPNNVRKVLEEHYVDCQDCRTQLSILLHLMIPSADENENKKFLTLLLFGEEAAARARSVIRKQQINQRSLWKRLLIQRPLLAPALMVIVLLTGSLIAYFVSSRQSSEERMLARIRKVYGNTRLIQGRVTGGFAHKQYVETRDPSDPTGLDERLRAALLSELDQEDFTYRRAATLHNMGRLFMLHGDLNPAEQQFLLALKERPRDAGLLADLGALYYERSRKEIKEEGYELLNKAVEHLSNAVEIDPKLAEARFNRALCYERMNLFLQAESDWKQYLTLDGDSAWAEEAREHLNELHERANRLEKLEQNVQAEFRAAEAAGDEPKMRELVAAHFVHVRNLAMDQLFDRYLSLALAGGKSQADHYLLSLRRIGRLINEIKGDRFVGDAVDFVARGSLKVKREAQVIHQTLQQARQEDMRGNTGVAAKFYEKAFTNADRIVDVCHSEMAALGLARYYHHKDESEKLIKLRNQLVIDAKRRNHRQLYAQALLVLANSEGAAQHLSISLELSKQAVEIAKSLGDHGTSINGLRFVGSAYASLGDYDSALKEFYKAIYLLRDSSVTSLMAAGVNDLTGDTLFRMSRYSTALPYQYEAVLRCGRSENIMILAFMTQRLGITYGMMGRHDEAMRYLNDAVARAEAIPDQIARVRLQIDLYTRFGEFYLKQNKINEAIATYQRAIDYIGKGDSRFHLSSIHKGLATAYLAQGKNSEAEAELEKSIRLTEEAREQIDDVRSRGTFLASQQSIYRSMVNFQFFNKEDPVRAFNYAEIAKARDLLDGLSGSPEVSTKDGQIKLAISRSATPLTLDQVQKALPANAQLVQYVSGEKNLMIWLVTRDRLITAKADLAADSLRTKVTAYLDEMRKLGNLDDLNHQAADLYQWLITPISHQLDPNRDLCIVPDGLLQNLPFASLVSPETKRYLIEDFSLVTNPSASVFARTLDLSRNKTRSTSETLLALGNPNFNKRAFPTLSPLPRSEQEIERIGSLYPQHQILTGKQATESALARHIGNYEIVHLATHALSDQKSSMLSTIFLAGESDSASEGKNPDLIANDGSLRAQEIYRLKPERTRLVVLSSCRSGLGDRSRNEAMGGLAQAFLIAGVPTVIASLWDVDDEGTARLMEKFHATYRGKKSSFGQALRQSQISFLQTAPQRLRHPFFWATFIVTGDGLAGQPEAELSRSIAFRAEKR